MTNKSRLSKQSGFTLIEILIVVGIIALLAALLLPLLGSVRDRARLSSCANNLHQIHLGLSQYASDNSGLLPPYPSQITSGGTKPPASLTCIEQSRELVQSVLPYSHSSALWRCPSDASSPVPSTSSCSDTVSLVKGNATSYRYQGWEWSESQVGFSPVGLDYARGDAAKRSLVEDDATCPSGGAQYSQYNHGGLWNRVFFDGHIKTFSLDCSTPGRHTEK
jgi:prepilin-type N-terminal cleavage/methylation domain-containing protein